MIRAIVACDSSGVIAVDGKIPWRYPADFRHFKRSTMGGIVIMGRKTWQSIPQKTLDAHPLPGRRVFALSRDQRYRGDGIAVVVRSLAEAIDNAATFAGRAPEQVTGIWICGGGEVYAEAARLDLIDEWDITIVPKVPFTAIEEIEGAKVVRCAIDRYRTEASGFKLEECNQPEGFAEAGLVRRVLRRRGEPRGIENARAVPKGRA